MPIFNLIASYLDNDGGVYEWEGEAEDYDDAVRKAQDQAWEDNHGDDGPDEGIERSDMLDEIKGFSVIDVTERYQLKAEIVTLLREEADKLDRTRHPEITDPASERADYMRALAMRFESMGTHA
jgi:hypothetical protein